VPTALSGRFQPYRSNSCPITWTLYVKIRHWNDLLDLQKVKNQDKYVFSEMTNLGVKIC